jgi:hypothetical protein
MFETTNMILICLTALIAAASGYKSGAPIVACDSMAPGHNVEAQIGPSRHSFTTRCRFY